MAKILKFLIVIAIVYFAVTKGLPWLKSQLADKMSLAGASNQEVCHHVAQRAADDFAERMRRFSTPPIDAKAWEDTVSETRYQVESADKQCRTCDHEACLETSRALDELGSMIKSFDESVQAGRGIPPDGASRFDRVYAALDRAQSLL